MANQKKLIQVKLLNKDFSVVCPENEKADLIAAAAYLEQKMRAIRNTTQDMSRVAIISALNIAHELLSLRQDKQLNSAKNELNKMTSAAFIQE